MQPHERKLMVALNGARTVVLGLSFAMMVTGCKRTPATDDASLNTQVQARLFADQNLNGQSIQTSVANGIVTLNGTVTSDSARTIASGDVAQVAGVKTVVDNLVVRPPQPGVTTAIAQPPAIRPDKAKKPSAATPQYTPPQPAPVVRNLSAAPPAPQPPAPVAQVQPPPPPPAPVRHDITLPAGTSIPVRITQTLDSKTTQSGDRFTGAIASDPFAAGLEPGQYTGTRRAGGGGPGRVLPPRDAAALVGASGEAAVIASGSTSADIRGTFDPTRKN